LDGSTGPRPDDPAFDQPRGRLDLAFANADTAARARPRLARALARLAEGTGAWVERPEAPGEGALDLWALAPTGEAATALAADAAAAIAERCGRRPLPDPTLDSRSRLALAWDEGLLARRGADRTALAEPVRAGLGQLDL